MNMNINIHDITSRSQLTTLWVMWAGCVGAASGVGTPFALPPELGRGSGVQEHRLASGRGCRCVLEMVGRHAPTHSPPLRATATAAHGVHIRAELRGHFLFGSSLVVH